MDSTLIDRIEYLKTKTNTIGMGLQLGNIPIAEFNTLTNKEWYSYGDARIVKQNYELIYRIDGINFKNYSKKDSKVLKTLLIDLIKINRIDPFLLFINGLFVKWEDILASYDHRNFYIHIHTSIKTPDSISIIRIPFNVKYSTDGSIPDKFTEIFRFDNNGKLSVLGNTIISMYNDSDNMLYINRNTQLGLFNEMIDIDFLYKLTSSNFICFKDGKLFNPSINIKPLNIVTIDNGAKYDLIYKIFYYKKVTFDYDMVNIPKNKSYLRNRFIDFSINPDPNNIASMIGAPFDFAYSSKKNHDDNLAAALYSICAYNSNLLGEAYSNCINTVSMTGTEVKDLLDENGILTMLRHSKYSKYSDTFVIVFRNGTIDNNYKSISYDLNTFSITIGYVEDDDIFEIVYFGDVNNRRASCVYGGKNQFTFDNSYIHTDDLLVFCKTALNPQFNITETDYTWYLLNYEKVDNSIVLDDFFIGKEVTFCSKKQFKYYNATIENESFKVLLPNEFSFCSNENQYMAFINGFKAPDGYRVVISKNDTPFNEAAIYFNTTLHPNDKVEIFYVPVPIFTDVLKPKDNLSATIYTKSGSRVYEIPLPYDNFIYDGNKMEVLIDNSIVPESMYTISPDTKIMTLSDSINPSPVKVLFNFYYTKKLGLNATGYININRSDAPVGIDKDLFFVFVNGKKIPLSKLQDVSETTIKITEDINSIENLSILRYVIPSVALTSTSSLWNSIINKQDAEKINNLMDTYNIISNIEEKRTPDLTTLSIMQEIVRDYWMKPGVNTGVPFVFEYDNSQFRDQDPGGNYVIPTWDALKYINIYEKDNPMSEEEFLSKYDK